MKILCISDHIDPLVYSNSIKERFKDIDLVLCAGDLPMEYLEFVVSSLNKSLLFVFGNHNLTEFHRYKNPSTAFSHRWSELEAAYGSGAIHVGSKVKREEGLIIAGLGGSMRYNQGENQYTEFQMKLEMVKLVPALIFNRIFRGRFLDILLTHASPRDIHDKADPCHRGFKSFLWFMRVFKPKYLIHGHIHLYDLSDLRTTRYQDTLVVNAFSHYIIETEERT
ncbi:MAG: metallophosphoesterase family protein [Spirochaetaceae bacterium]|jgi:Icc-related predicted phosphoesterase|nr:metallophosphoesterase family protein [Spirochaetaceae bacterium]